MKITKEWFGCIPNERDLLSMDSSWDVRVIGRTEKSVCVKWKCYGARDVQYWIDIKYIHN